MTLHKQVMIKVNAEVDEEVAALVLALNEIDGVVTLDSCQDGGHGWGAYVYFTYLGGWKALAALLQELASALGHPGVGCGYALRLEWFGSNDEPRAQIACEPEHMPLVAEGVRRAAPILNARRTELGGDR